jgi:hypothetical protein
MRFLLAVLLGVGLTLAWQSYGEDAKEFIGPWAKETIATYAPSLGSLLPSWTTAATPQQPAAKSTGSSPGTGAAARQVPSSPVRDLPLDEAVVRPVATQPVATQPAGPASPELAQRLDAITRDLAAVGRTLEQLAAKQDQVTEKITTLQAQIEQKLSSPAVPPAPRDNAPRPAAAARGATSPAR